MGIQISGSLVRGLRFRHSNFGTTNGPDPICPVCEKTMGNSHTVVVRTPEKVVVEVHRECYK